MKRFIKMSSVTVFLLALNVHGAEIDVSNMTFNSLAEKKAYIAQKEKEAEEQEKNKEVYEKKIENEWIQEIQNVLTQALKLMAIKNTDSLEVIEAKYKNRTKIVDAVYKNFDALYAKHSKLISYSSRGEVFYRNVSLGKNVVKDYERFFGVSFDTLGDVHYSYTVETDEKSNDDLKFDNNYYLESTYSLEGILKHYLLRVERHFENAKSEHEALTNVVEGLDIVYENGLNKAFDTFKERQEELKLKLEIEKWGNIGIHESEIHEWKEANISFEEAKKWMDLYHGTISQHDVLQFAKSDIGLDEAKNWSEMATYYCTPEEIMELKKHGINSLQDFLDWQQISKEIKPENVIKLHQIGIDKPEKLKPWLQFFPSYKEHYYYLTKMIEELEKIFQSGIKTPKEYDNFLTKKDKKRKQEIELYNKEVAKHKNVCDAWLKNARQMTYSLDIGDKVKSKNGVVYQILGNYNNTFFVQFMGTQFHIQKSESLPANATPPNKYCRY